MPKSNPGKSRVRGGSTKNQKRAKAPKGSSGSHGGKKHRSLTKPKQGPAHGSSY